MSDASSSSKPPQAQGAQALMALLLLVPGLAALAFITRFAVNCLFWDEWAIVPYLEDFYAHRLTLARFFEQHNEHRLFFPRLIFVYLGTLTSYDTRVFMYLSWGCLAAGMLCLARLHVRLYGSSTRSLAFLLPVAVLQFHLRQYENLLWGWQLQMVMCVALFLGAVTLLADERAGWKQVAGAVACLLVATFTFSSGLVAWPAVLLLLAYQRLFVVEADAVPMFNRRLLAVVLAAAAAFALYLHGYLKPTDHPNVTFVLHHPGAGLSELCGAMGSSAGYFIDVCIWAGGLTLALALVVLFFFARGWVDRRKFAPAVPLFAFSLGVSMMIAVGRAGFGIYGANASRYVTLTLPALIGLYYGALAVHPGRRRTALVSVMLAALLVTVVVGDQHVLDIGRQEEARRELGVDVMLHPDHHTASEAKVLYPNTDIIIPYSRVMALHHLNVFAE